MSNKPIKLPYQTISEMKDAATRILPADVSEYLNSGSSSGGTMRKNKEVYNDWALIPRRLKGVSYPDSSVTVFGQKYHIPFGAAPVGIQQLFHRDGETATAKACSFHKAPCILSTVSNISYEKSTLESNPKPWFQLYPTDNFSITKELIDKAENAGAKVIVLTVDVPVLGKRKHNARALLSTTAYRHLHFGNLKNLLKKEDNVHDPNLNWNMLSMIKEYSSCKIVVKGILHHEDAKLCMESGADGIIISNHGGRQLDSNYSTLEALAEIRRFVPAKFPLFIDGGIRSAEDILKAILLGAKMVFVGRPICYGLAIGGQTGVDHLLNILKIDLLRNMQLMGIQDFSKLDYSQIKYLGKN